MCTKIFGNVFEGSKWGCGTFSLTKRSSGVPEYTMVSLASDLHNLYYIHVRVRIFLQIFKDVKLQ